MQHRSYLKLLNLEPLIGFENTSSTTWTAGVLRLAGDRMLVDCGGKLRSFKRDKKGLCFRVFGFCGFRV